MSHLKTTTPSNVPSSVETAAVEAALADGLIQSNGLYASDEKAKKAGLRRGKWTSEEEFYANRLIYEFKLGLLPLTDGTTLRTFLSKLLNCDPMRISKKFVGQNCIGKQVFRRRQQDLEKLTPEQIELSRRELAELERKFLEKVAQTNRSKSSAAATGAKDGRVDYEDENGNTVAAPWMVPPTGSADDSSSSSTSNGHGKAYCQQSAAAYASGNGSQFANQDPYQQYQQAGGYPTYQQQVARYNSAAGADNHRGAYLGATASGDDSFPRVTSMDLLNTIANLNSSSASLDNYLNSDADTLKQQQYQHQQRNQPGYGAPLDPTADVFPSLATNSSTFTLGDNWPSFSNLNAFGASMDDLTTAGAVYASTNTSNTTAVDTTAQDRAHKPSSLSVDEINSIGYPLDDTSQAAAPTSAGASVNATTAGGAALSPSKYGNGTDAQAQQRAQAQVRVKAPIVDVAGMTAMAHMYQPTGGSSSRSSSGSGNGINMNSVSVDRTSNAGGLVPVPIITERLFESNAGRPQALSSGGTPGNYSAAQGMPKNGSVEDFWMLVNMGDLPQPEQNVLSQRVWSPLARAGSGGSVGTAGFGSTSVDQQAGDGGAGAGAGGVPAYYLPPPPQQQQLLQHQQQHPHGQQVPAEATFSTVAVAAVPTNGNSKRGEVGGAEDDGQNKRVKY